jgi:hypothetical protein
MIPKNKLEKYRAREQKKQREYRKRKKSPLFVLGGTTIFHFLMAVILSFVPVKQPTTSFPPIMHDRTKSLDVVFLEEPLPEIKINKIEPVKTDNSVKKAVTVKEKIPVKQKSTPQKSETKTAWELALLAKQGKSGQGTSGSPGLKGTRGNPGDRPGMTASGGIIDKERITQTGGTGLKTDRVVPMSVLPAGNGNTIGAGGKGTSGFKYGALENGRGTGRADIPGRGGSGGTGGKGEDGPGQGLSGTGSGRGSGGKGTTGIGLGNGTGDSGMGTGSGPGTGSGKGGIGEGGPGTGGHGTDAPRSNPGLVTKAADGNNSVKDSPRKNPTVNDKRDAIGKEGFKADLGKDMNNAKTATPDKSDSHDYSDALQEEINRDLHSLRKLYEDWQNSKIPDIPKALQITLVLNKKGGEPKVSSIDLHNNALSSRIKDDLTKRIKSWKFKSLNDGKDDPSKWPVSLNGRISWQ